MTAPELHHDHIAALDMVFRSVDDLDTAPAEDIFQLHKIVAV